MQILPRAFYARQDTKTPMRVAFMQVALNVGLGLTLFYIVGVRGIAAATSLASWFSVVQLALILRKRGHYAPSGQAWSRLARILAAAAVLGAVLAVAAANRGRVEGALHALTFGPIHGKELAVALVCALALPLYGALLFASGGVRPAEFKKALKRR